MSSLRMFVIETNGNLREFASFGNSFLGWSLFWDWMEQQYFPPAPGKLFVSLFVESMFAPKKNVLDKFWKLAYDPGVGINRRIVLRCTYDGAMLKKGDFGVAAAAFRDVAGDMRRLSYTRDVFFETVAIDSPGHLPAVASKLDEASKLDGIIGACWQATTVTTDAWNDGLFNIFTDKNPPFDQYWINPLNVNGDGENGEINAG